MSLRRKYVSCALISSFLFVTIASPQLLAAGGTVTITTGYPIAVQPAPPMMQRKVEIMGSETPASGWTYHSASTHYKKRGGGSVPSAAPLDQQSGLLGKLEGSPQYINKQSNAISPSSSGTYDVWIEAIFKKEVDGTITTESVSSAEGAVVFDN